MTTRTHRTIAPRFAVAALLLVAAACGNKRDLRTARQSIYDADFAIVYSEAIQAVGALYPRFDEDATSGVIRTAWHQVTYSNGGSEDAASTLSTSGVTPAGQAGGGMPPNVPGTVNSGQLIKRYFIRFDVSVLGGRPWRIRVVGHASEWSPGNAVAAELRGEAIPHWLSGRSDELTVAIYRRLKQYARPAPIDAVAVVDDGPAIDPAQFGKIPTDAASAAVAIVHAVEVRDPVALRAMIAADVVWSLGAPPGIDAALATWEADGTAIDALAEALRAGCATADDKVICPAAASAPTFTGWRATLGRRGPGWKLVEFVRGD
jgi:hypothetical protein